MATQNNSGDGAETNPPLSKAVAAAGALVLIAATAIVLATVVGAGSQLAGSPTAAADTTSRPTPFLGNGRFMPVPAPKPTSNVSSQGSPQAPQESVGGATTWFSEAAPPFNDVQGALQDMTTAAQAQDFVALKGACERLDGATRRLEGTLPSPNQTLTNEAEAAINDLESATSACLAADPDSGAAGFSAVQSHVQAAIGHFQNAQELIQG